MKAFCINITGWYNPITLKDGKGPKFGDYVTVIREYKVGRTLYYNILEWPPVDDTDGFEAVGFIPLSEIDERKLVNLEYA